MSAWTTTVGRLRRAPPACAVPPGARRVPVFLSIVSPLQTATRASAMRWSKGVRSRPLPSRWLAAMSERLTTSVLVLGKRPGQSAAPIVEAEEAPGVGARSSARRTGSAWPARARGPAWPTSAWPVRPSWASVSGLATSTSGLTWSKESFPCDSASAILGSEGSLAAAVTHSRAVAAETPHRWTSQATMEVAPSTRQARRRSSSATAARSWLWCAEIARWCWVTLATSASVRRDTRRGGVRL